MAGVYYSFCIFRSIRYETFPETKRRIDQVNLREE